MKPVPKPPELAERAEFRLIVLGLGLLALAALVALVSFSATTPSLADKVYIYLFGFLGLGMLLAMVIHRWFERRNLRHEDDEWL
jgi:membrane protein implicated in regulation of membrane protease activity